MGIGEDATNIYERLMLARRSNYSVEDLRYMRTVYELARCYVERYCCQEGEALLERLLTASTNICLLREHLEPSRGRIKTVVVSLCEVGTELANTEALEFAREKSSTYIAALEGFVSLQDNCVLCYLTLSSQRSC